VTFRLFAKVDVNGSDAAPLFQHLKSVAKGVLGSEAIKWNFTKFLVDVAVRYVGGTPKLPHRKIWQRTSKRHSP
jgi:glutathione peroxidase-family protein